MEEKINTMNRIPTGCMAIAPRRDTLANWMKFNSVIHLDNLAVVEDEGTFVKGDGVTPFRELERRPISEFIHAWLCEGGIISSFR